MTAIHPWIEARRRLADKATEPPWFADGVAKDGRTIVDDGRSSWSNDIHCETTDGKFIADARASLPLACDAIEVALEALEKRTHHRYCEDSFYSCPKHPEGCTDDNAGTECDCGADVAIAALARIEALVQGKEESR